MRRLMAICLVLFLIAYAVPSFAMGGGGKNRNKNAHYAQNDLNRGGGDYNSERGGKGHDSGKGGKDHDSDRGKVNNNPSRGNHRVPEPEISALIGSLILGGLLFNGVRRIRSKR